MILNKRTIEKLQLPLKDKPYYKLFRDEKLPGFCIRVSSSGAKTFIIDKRIDGKLIRSNIGLYGHLTAESARKEARKLLGKLAAGFNPAKEKKRQQQSNITLQEALEDYLKIRKTLKTRTTIDYRNMIKFDFSDWQKTPLIQITKPMVVKRHAKIGERSQASANNALKLISAIFNFAIAKYEDSEGENVIKENPVEQLSRLRAWYPKKRKRTKIENHQLHQWYQAVSELKSFNQVQITGSVKYYLMLLLFTGLRKDEALPLIWSEHKSENKKESLKEHILDLKGKTIYIPDPKNRQEHWLPLSDYLIKLFTEYKKINSSKYVFPNTKGSNHFKEPKRVIRLVEKNSGVRFTLHDLRRTFASIADSIDISAYALKRLLNHKMISSDVTAGYIVTDIDRLKKPMQEITNRILELISGNS